MTAQGLEVFSQTKGTVFKMGALTKKLQLIYLKAFSAEAVMICRKK